MDSHNHRQTITRFCKTLYRLDIIGYDKRLDNDPPAIDFWCTIQTYWEYDGNKS